MSARQVPSVPLWTTLLVVLAAVGVSGCSALGIRQSVEEAQARQLLTEAVGLAVSGDFPALCELSPAEASTCEDSVDRFGELVPAEGPEVMCTFPAPDSGPLRGGFVLVVTGEDASGVDYTSEFVVFDDGEQVGVLDAVYWSGLTIVDYTEDTVTWRFDSTSTSCERSRLPAEQDS